MLIDPHGDLVESVLDLVSPDRVADTIYFNPADAVYPLAFNPLAHIPGIPAHLQAAGLLAVFKKAWPEFWGPRMEYVLHTSLLTLVSLPGTTLLDLHRLLIDPAFRQQLVSRLTDPQLLQFWHQEFGRYTTTFRLEAVAPIINRTGQYLTIPLLRHIIGQRSSTVSLRAVMDEGKIMLVNLAKGQIGEELATLLGTLLVTQLELAALSRVDVPDARRRDFFLY